MHGTRLFALVGVGLISGVVGCGATRLYSGPTRTPDEVAIIRTIDSSRVTRIDESDISTKTVEVLPGRVKLRRRHCLLGGASVQKNDSLFVNEGVVSSP
jgi:hypothetical protein